MTEHDTPDFSQKGQLLPQEEMLEISRSKSNISIGIPKEIHFQENRVPIAPESVAVLIQNGHSVKFEDGAGDAAHFTTKDYAEAGAQIVYSPQEVFQSDIILKVAPPSLEEISMMKGKQYLFSAINMPGQNQDYFKALKEKQITAIAFEFIRDKTNAYPIMRSMSEIAGSASIIISAEYLSNPKLGRGKMLGGYSGITPSEVVIIGSGTVGEYAARTALGLGAVVKLFDDSVYKLRNVQNRLGTRIFTSILQPKVLAKELKSADVVIGALHSETGMSPCVVTEDMIRSMKEGSVVVDVSIDQGGCFETSRVTSHHQPIFTKHDVIHYCVPNIAARVPHTASFALSNYFTPVFLRGGEIGGMNNLLKANRGLCKGVYMYQGKITNRLVGSSFSLPFQSIEMLLSSFDY